MSFADDLISVHAQLATLQRNIDVVARELPPNPERTTTAGDPSGEDARDWVYLRDKARSASRAAEALVHDLGVIGKRTTSLAVDR